MERDLGPAWALTHRPRPKAVLYFRVWPLVLTAALLAFAVGCLVAVLTQDLEPPRDITIPGYGALALGGAVFVGYRAWRTWPTGGNLCPVRADADGVALLKGKAREPFWFEVPWSSIGAVTYAMIEPSRPVPERIAHLRVLSFVPRPEADIPPGPPGLFDPVLDLPDREKVLTFVALHTWDEDIRSFLDELRTRLPDLPVLDTVG